MAPLHHPPFTCPDPQLRGRHCGDRLKELSAAGHRWGQVSPRQPLRLHLFCRLRGIRSPAAPEKLGTMGPRGGGTTDRQTDRERQLRKAEQQVWWGGDRCGSWPLAASSPRGSPVSRRDLQAAVGLPRGQNEGAPSRRGRCSWLSLPTLMGASRGAGRAPDSAPSLVLTPPIPEAKTLLAVSLGDPASPGHTGCGPACPFSAGEAPGEGPAETAWAVTVREGSTLPAFCTRSRARRAHVSVRHPLGGPILGTGGRAGGQVGRQ